MTQFLWIWRESHNKKKKKKLAGSTPGNPLLLYWLSNSPPECTYPAPKHYLCINAALEVFDKQAVGLSGGRVCFMKERSSRTSLRPRLLHAYAHQVLVAKRGAQIRPGAVWGRHIALLGLVLKLGHCYGLQSHGSECHGLLVMQQAPRRAAADDRPGHQVPPTSRARPLLHALHGLPPSRVQGVRADHLGRLRTGLQLPELWHPRAPALYAEADHHAVRELPR